MKKRKKPVHSWNGNSIEEKAGKIKKMVRVKSLAATVWQVTMCAKWPLSRCYIVAKNETDLFFSNYSWPLLKLETSFCKRLKKLKKAQASCCCCSF